MENIFNKARTESLLLLKNTFRILLEEIIKYFKDSNNISTNYNNSQLYGFGNFDTEKPNLKDELEQILKGYVNGKYLYNKFRELQSGKPIIKISRDYKFLFFNYLGYKDIYEFLETNLFDEIEKKSQIELLNKGSQQSNYYYVCYYYGEDNKMNKGEVIIYNDWKKLEIIYVYPDNNGYNEIYSFYGTIKQSDDFIFFDTKYYIGGKNSEGAKFTFFIGKSSPNERNYLVGTYSGFDKYDRAIAGKIILKKYNSKSEIEEEVNNVNFDPIICQEINKSRIVVESNIRKNPLLFSKQSPYSQILLKISGNYNLTFKLKKQSYSLKINIENYHYNIICLNEAIIIENDKITLLSKSQILNFDFYISGIFYLQKVSIYLNTQYFIKNKEKATGSFNGVDVNNKIISGDVLINPI